MGDGSVTKCDLIGQFLEWIWDGNFPEKVAQLLRDLGDFEEHALK